MGELKFEEGKIYRIAKIGIRDTFYWRYRRQFRGCIVELKHYFNETNHSKGYIGCLVVLRQDIELGGGTVLKKGTVLPFTWVKLTEI